MSAISFTKLFSSITDSSIWQESSDSRVVWVTLLAMADPLGRIQASISGLARRSNVSREATESALAVFLSPDPDSRTTDHEGRRIAVIEGGWQLLNYKRYREMKDEEATKEANRVRQERYRKNNAVSRSVTDSNAVSQEVTESNDKKKEKLEVEEEADVRTTTSTLASSSTELPAAPRKLVCTLPLNQGEHQVFEDDVQQWQALYLAIDIRQELRSMKGWLIGNPKLRKTKTGIARFINSWMSRAQNEAKPTGGGHGIFKGKSGHSVDAAKAAIEEVENHHASGAAWDSETGEAGQRGLPSFCG